MVSNITTNPPPCSASSDHNPSGPLQLLLTTPFLGATKCSPFPAGEPPAVLPPPDDLGPDSLVLTQRKAVPDPSGSRRVDLGQSLQEWAGRASRGGNPSISLSPPGLCWAPSPTPNRAWVGTVGSQKGRGEDRHLYFVAIIDVKMELIFLLNLPSEATHHHSQEERLSIARTGCHGGWGRQAGVEFWSCICRFRQKTEIVSLFIKKREGKWKLWGEFNAPKLLPRYHHFLHHPPHSPIGLLATGQPASMS